MSVTIKRGANPLYDHCVKNRFYMASPQWEIPAVNKMINFIENKIESGAQALLIGTPVALTYSNNLAFKERVISIELTLAKALSKVTNNLRIKIGDLVDPLKAQAKKHDWKTLLPANKLNVQTGPVNADSYREEVYSLLTKGNYVKKTIDNPLIVTLMNSGLWVGSDGALKKYGWNSNFKDPSIELTEKFSNLHILTMVRAIGGRGFAVSHVHDGKEKTI